MRKLAGSQANGNAASDSWAKAEMSVKALSDRIMNEGRDEDDKESKKEKKLKKKEKKHQKEEAQKQQETINQI